MVCSTPQQRKQPLTRPASWLNPRRRRNCETLIRYLAWHGRKIHLDPGRYFDLAADENMDKFVVDAAVDDLWSLGLIDISMIGNVQSVRLLSDQIDAAPAAEAPRFVLARGGVR